MGSWESIITQQIFLEMLDLIATKKAYAHGYKMDVFDEDQTDIEGIIDVSDRRISVKRKDNGYQISKVTARTIERSDPLAPGNLRRYAEWLVELRPENCPPSPTFPSPTTTTTGENEL